MMNYKVTVTSRADKDEASIYNISCKNLVKFTLISLKKTYWLFRSFTKATFYWQTSQDKPRLRVYIFNKQNKVVYEVKETNIVIIRILHTKTNLASKY